MWQELNLEAVRLQLTDAGMARGMVEMILKLDPKSKLMVITLLWLWWGERNTRREEGYRRSASEVAFVTAALTDRFPKTELVTQTRTCNRKRRWVKPLDGFQKLNSDGAFCTQEKAGGWGYVIRDENGRVVKARAGRESFLQSAFHAELLWGDGGCQGSGKIGNSTLGCRNGCNNGPGSNPGGGLPPVG